MQKKKKKNTKRFSTFNQFENAKLHEKQLFCPKIARKKLDFVQFLKTSCIFAKSNKRYCNNEYYSKL